MPKRFYFGELLFSRETTPAVVAIDTPVLEAGSILRLRGRHLSGPDASIRIYRAAASGAIASRMLSTAGGVERRLQCAQDDGEGHLYARSGVDASTGEEYAACRTFTNPVGVPAGHWNVTLIQMGGNRGKALVESGARRVDLSSDDIYDLDTLARVYSVFPRAGSAAGGTMLTVRGSGFGSMASEVEVEVGGVRAERVFFIDPTAEPSDTMVVKVPDLTGLAVGQVSGAVYPTERGVRLQAWQANRSAEDPSSGGSGGERRRLHSLERTWLPPRPVSCPRPFCDLLRLTPFPTRVPTAPPAHAAVVNEQEAVLESFDSAWEWDERSNLPPTDTRLSGWFLPPRTAKYSLLLRSANGAKLWWSGTAETNRTELLATDETGGYEWCVRHLSASLRSATQLSVRAWP